MERIATQKTFFTAPWEPVAIRRGDALGLRALTDEIADRLAPGLSNRTQDVRWVSILSWCLTRCDALWRASGGTKVSGRQAAAGRYAWLRPLELMWVARTMVLARDDWRGRQLPGQRRVGAWLNDGRLAPQFSMSADQYRNYRQTGPYGAYRVAFRRWFGLTRGGDGWTPGEKCNELARRIDEQLGTASFPVASFDGRKRVHGQTWSGCEDEWWLKHWRLFDSGRRRSAAAMLPRKRDDFSRVEEADLVRSILFRAADDAPFKHEAQRRSRTIAVIRTSTAASHQKLCAELAKKLKQEVTEIIFLPRFVALADAGMEVMDAVFKALQEPPPARGLTFHELLDFARIRRLSRKLRSAAKRWEAQSNRLSSGIRHLEAMRRFASAVCTTSEKDCLKRLALYHQQWGGGLHWFSVQDGRVIPNAAFRQERTARYRFRLWALARMAVQCGELSRMPLCLQEDFAAEGDVEEES